MTAVVIDYWPSLRVASSSSLEVYKLAALLGTLAAIWPSVSVPLRAVALWYEKLATPPEAVVTGIASPVEQQEQRARGCDDLDCRVTHAVIPPVTVGVEDDRPGVACVGCAQREPLTVASQLADVGTEVRRAREVLEQLVDPVDGDGRVDCRVGAGRELTVDAVDGRLVQHATRPEAHVPVGTPRPHGRIGVAGAQCRHERTGAGAEPRRESRRLVGQAQVEVSS